MKILVYGSDILAVSDFSETDDAFTSTDVVFPKTVITGWQVIEATLPADYAHGKYTFSNGVFTPRVIFHTESKTAEQAKHIRDSRTWKLQDCDWTQLVDSTADKAAWATHRQALRDITKQAGFPWTVEWPTSP